MGIIQRQAITNTIINYIGVALGFVNVIIVFPLFLSDEEFGLTRLVLSLLSVMAQLSSFGVMRIAVKFFPFFRKEQHKNNGLLVLLFLLAIAGSTIISLLYFLFKDTVLSFYNDDTGLFAAYYYWIPLGVLGMLVFMVFEAFLQSLKKTVFTNFLRNVGVRIFWLLALLMYYFNYISFYQFMVFYTLAFFTIAFICVIQLIAIKEFKFDFNAVYFRKRVIKPIVNYGAYTVFSGITLVIVVSVDTLMIGALLPDNKLENIAVYAVATYIVSVIMIPNSALSRIASPLLAIKWKAKDLNGVGEIYQKSALLMLFVGGLIYGAIALNVDNMLALMKPEYASAKWVIIILGAARLFSMSFGINHAILVITKFYRAETFLAIFLLVLVVITNLLLIPLYGIIGAATGTAIALTVFNVLLYFYIEVKYHLKPFSINTLKMLFFGITAFVPVLFIPKLIAENHILTMVIKTTLFGILYFIPVYYFKVSEDVNSLVDKYLSKLKKK